MSKVLQWETSEKVDHCDEDKCTCCGSFSRKLDIRWVLPDLGSICSACYFDGTRCDVDGCLRPAIFKESVCREHYIDDRETHDDLIEYWSSKQTGGYIPSDVGPPEGIKLLNSQITVFMKNHNIPVCDYFLRGIDKKVH